MKHRRWAVGIVVLALGLIPVPATGAPPRTVSVPGSAISADPGPTPLLDGSAGLEQQAPDVTAGDLAAAPSVSVGESVQIDWSAITPDPDAGDRIWLSDIAGATVGEDYEAVLAGAGELELWVFDSAGSPVAVGSHPDAAIAAPRVQWTFEDGDVILALNPDQSASPPPSTLDLSLYSGDGRVHGPSSTLTALYATGMVAPADPYIPFFGTHFDRLWERPAAVAAGRVLRVALESTTLTDPVVLLIDSQGEIVDGADLSEQPVDFVWGSGDRLLVTSAYPDDFGTYSIHWSFLAGPAVITSALGSTPDQEGVDGSSIPPSTIRWSETPLIDGAGEHPGSYRLEYSADRDVWRSADGTASGGQGLWSIPDGTWWVRLYDDRDVVSNEVKVTCTGDTTHWLPSGLRLTLPSTAPAGKPDGYRDLVGAIRLVETYTDGRTRLAQVLPVYQIQELSFQRSGSSTWTTLPYSGGTFVVLPETGRLRVTHISGLHGDSEVIPVVAATAAVSGSFDRPIRSEQGGAMDFRGSVRQRWADGSWRTALDGTTAKVQWRSGGRWRTLHTAAIGDAAPGVVATTAQLRGPGRYRVVVRGEILGSWYLRPATPTRTATVVAPEISKVDSDGRVRFVPRVRQRYSDGHVGPGAPGWMMRIQYRAGSGARWRTMDRFWLPTQPLNGTPSYGAGHGQWRVVGTYRNRTYVSAITRI